MIIFCNVHFVVREVVVVVGIGQVGVRVGVVGIVGVGVGVIVSFG